MNLPSSISCLQRFHNVGSAAGRASGLYKMGGWWRWALVSPDGVAPSRMVVCLPLLIFSCTIKSGSSLLAPAHPGGPGKRAVKQLWWWWCGCQAQSNTDTLSCCLSIISGWLPGSAYLGRKPQQHHTKGRCSLSLQRYEYSCCTLIGYSQASVLAAVNSSVNCFSLLSNLATVHQHPLTVKTRLVALYWTLQRTTTQ